jgi:hypothetical protein
VAPFIIVFGAALPVALNQTFPSRRFGQQLAVYAAWLLTGAMASLLVLMFIEDQLAPRGRCSDQSAPSPISSPRSTRS